MALLFFLILEQALLNKNKIVFLQVKTGTFGSTYDSTSTIRWKLSKSYGLFGARIYSFTYPKRV